jgi:hypothetical protein
MGNFGVLFDIFNENIRRLDVNLDLRVSREFNFHPKINHLEVSKITIKCPNLQ